MSPTVILVTVLLLLFNAFFVGAEFAAMAARRSQLEPLADAGDKRAAQAVYALEHTGVLLATCQLGITVCSVLLGAVSEAALHHALHPVMERLGVPHGLTDVASLVLAIMIVVYLHVVVGEMVPKNLAIAGPEASARWLVPPLLVVMRLTKPVIMAMDWVSKAFVRAMGIEPKDELDSAVTAEEVQQIVDESHREGLVETDQYGLVGAALEFSDKDAADVGIPVADLVTVPEDASPEDIERLVAKHGFSRYPTVSASGELTGYLHLKDVLYAEEAERAQPVPRKRLRRLATVQREDEVEDVLRTMQVTGAHVARVIDDAGAIIGLVFLEDVIEELVGEVSDSTQR
ncbi:hemolysin family protein [Marihabitans asiaticum]|uniref:CBS domain containing-hemolysin-like protein n=1 Tax=Marihabitans asiaticum TaxID=415218 RepID=A0A560W8Q1_9MICO|nr:hemolysin family protein [Marihabitans asiaticum]TWD13905.1 CBS domain containing-hemolysin-like protein [Marihabitans asiaticum]